MWHKCQEISSSSAGLEDVEDSGTQSVSNSLQNSISVGSWTAVALHRSVLNLCSLMEDLMLFCNPEKAPAINTCTELEKAETYTRPTGTHPFHQKQQSSFTHEGLEKGSYRQEKSQDPATTPGSGLPEHSSLTKESPSGNASNREKYPTNFPRAGILLSATGARRPMSPVQSILFLLHHPVEASNHERR